jgi:hypothetical protein
MKIKNISYPTSLDKIKDISDDNVDVFIELNDGMEYMITVSTPKNYYTLMEKEGCNYIEPGPADIIVKELTEQNIREAVTKYLEDDAYWLKLIYLSGERQKAFDINLMNEKLNEIKLSNAYILGD